VIEVEHPASNNNPTQTGPTTQIIGEWIGERRRLWLFNIRMCFTSSIFAPDDNSFATFADHFNRFDTLIVPVDFYFGLGRFWFGPNLDLGTRLQRCGAGSEDAIANDVALV
jgi:hypothetical protein